MKKRIVLFTLMLTVAAVVQAKKVKVTIEGTAYPTTKLYLIVNEDTANAQILDIKDGKFMVNLKVEKDAFIRIHDYKEWPERSGFVLIPDSKYITIDWRNGEIKGSEKSKELKMIMDNIKKLGPEGFHIDVFSEDKEEWERARKKANEIRMKMEMDQRELMVREIELYAKTNYPAWIYFCYHDKINIPMEILSRNKKAKWANHEIIKVLDERKKK